MIINNIVDFKGAKCSFESFKENNDLVVFKTKDNHIYIIIHSMKIDNEVVFLYKDSIYSYYELTKALSNYISGEVNVITCYSSRLYRLRSKGLVLKPFSKVKGKVNIRAVEDGFEIVW